jgi:hypothetical protein
MLPRLAPEDQYPTRDHDAPTGNPQWPEAVP